MSLSSYIAALLILLAAFGVWYWLDGLEENVVIDILASQEEELGLPIYAQFVATQALTLERPAAIKRVVVPVYFPAEDVGLTIDLLEEGVLVQRWRVKPSAVGIAEVDLELDPVWALAGQLAVRFSAAGVGHEQVEAAPRVFVESADGQYPGGHYRIADNDKQGDISLTVVEQRRVWERVLQMTRQQPLRVVAYVGSWVVAFVLLLALPFVLARVARPGGA